MNAVRWLAWCVASSQLLAATAHAGPVEQLVDVAFGPGDSPVMIARYDQGGGGLVFSADDGRNWKLQCDSAVLPAGAKADEAPVVLDDGSVLLPNSLGLSRGDLQGCNWHAEALGSNATALTKLSPDPTRPNEALALVTTATGMTTQTQLMHRAASGQWAAFGSADDRLPLDLRVTVHDGQLRVYELVVVKMQDASAAAVSFAYKLRVSDDRALSWREFPLANGASAKLIGIDPAHADTVAVLLDRDQENDVITVSRDQGATFQPYLEVNAFGGMAWAPDGRVWIGDMGSASVQTSTGMPGMQGLWAATNIDTSATRLSMADYPVQCVAYRPENNTLYVCQHFWLGAVAADTGAFSRLLSFATVDAFVGCGTQEIARSCEQQLCVAYCGVGHFAVAPVCGAYDQPGCGVPVARDEGAAWASTQSNPMPAADGGGPSVPAGGGAGQSGAAVIARAGAPSTEIAGGAAASGAAAGGAAAASGGAATAAGGAAAANGGAAAMAPTQTVPASSGSTCGIVRQRSASGAGLSLLLIAVLRPRLRRRTPRG